MMCLVLCLLVLQAIFVTNFAAVNNAFVSALYKQIIENKRGNFMISPFSVQHCLSLLQSGCKGSTAQELESLFLDPSTLPKLTGNDYTFNIANKIYVKKNLSVKNEFKKIVFEAGSEIEEIDFSKPETSAKINQWLEKKTSNKIQKVIEANQLTNKTQAVIVNALYFNGSWAIEFPPMFTKKAKFFKDGNEEVKVDTMFLDEKELFYYDCPHLEAQFLELPFKGEDASMTIVLPHINDGLKSLESNIESVFAPHNLTKETVVTVALPKFKIDSKFDLKKTLKILGVRKIFDKNEADLSGIAGEKGDLIVSKIFQRTFVDVNEKGVEAAAGTYIPDIVLSMGSVTPPKIFIVDHPFIFFIRVKGVVIFLGRVTAPNYL